MVMAHWAEQSAFRQVMWQLDDDIKDRAATLGDNVRVVNSVDDPAVHFEFNSLAGDTGYFSLTFETVNDPYEVTPSQSVEFCVRNSESFESHEVTRSLAVEERYVDKFHKIHTVNADEVLEMLREWLQIDAEPSSED